MINLFESILNLLNEKDYTRQYKLAREKGMPPKEAAAAAKKLASDKNPDDKRTDRLTKYTVDSDVTGTPKPGQVSAKKIRKTVKKAFKKVGREEAVKQAKDRDMEGEGTADKNVAASRRKIRREMYNKSKEGGAAGLRKKLFQGEHERRQKGKPLNVQKGKQTLAKVKGVNQKGIVSSTQIIGNALVEAFKQACWGERYKVIDEATPEPGTPEYRKMMLLRAEKKNKKGGKPITPVEKNRLKTKIPKTMGPEGPGK